ncbi:TetR/AcrR family transcriptional regulator [Propionispora sp. 2/2-37]|uniref:TetR/AcrR family transcriptional regulator n=1 Tax=Propionispora sp. 2/2-37 TaxID=1677858 RepID=UPI0006BB6685|nr:TetR/AcrR family transcriptional regulator [Propionispora sp. 2/2-37]
MTKDNITSMALRLFLLRGYKYVSLADVAKAAGMTKGAIYHYFSGKEELLAAAVYYLFDRMEEKCLRLFQSPVPLKDTLYAILVEQELAVYARQLLTLGEGDYRTNHASFILEVMSHYPKLQERIDRNHLTVCSAIEQKLERAIAQGEIRKEANTRALAVMILAVINGQVSLGEKLNSLAIRRQMADNFWKLISA